MFDTFSASMPAPVILVVDDNAGIRNFLEIGLSGLGFQVWAAADGAEAVRLYESHRDSIQGVLLDIRMPGLDGPHTVLAIKEIEPNVPFCFMSGELGNYTEEELLQLGAHEVVKKPFNITDVAAMLLEMVKKGSATLVPSGL